MAELNYIDYGEDDNGLNSDYYTGGDDEFGFDDTDMQDNQLPLEKLDTYLNSDNSYTRQLVASGLPDALKTAKDAQERQIVLDAVNKLSQDDEASVKSEILERIPPLAEYCMQNAHVDGLSDAIHSTVLPSVVRCLHDGDNQVRKMSQMALLLLLENRMVQQADIDAIVCPVLLELFTPDRMPEEFRTEAVSLMVRISPLVSTHVVETQFLPRFCELCSESMFHIRKVCATSIGEMCRVVGPSVAEKHLLPKFFSLCEDAIWGVRKACTECFMEVSNALSPSARRKDLAQLFVGLLCDQSRWVRMSAFQALGPFISTFANPDTTGLYFDRDGILRVDPAKQPSQSPEPTAPPAEAEATGSSLSDDGAPSLEESSESKSTDDQVKSEPATDRDAMDISTDEGSEDSEGQRLVCNTAVSPEEVRCRQYTKDTELVYVEGETEASKIDEFGSFKYWREPVPTLDLDKILKEVSQSSAEADNDIPASGQLQPDVSSDVHDIKLTGEEVKELTSNLQSNLQVSSQTTGQQQLQPQTVEFMFGPQSTPLGSISNLPLAPVMGQSYASVVASGASNARARNVSSGSLSGSESSNNMESDLLALQQDIIPHLLLENYLSMTDPSRAQTVDMDIAQHCAYSLPAVAYTLGKEHWKCLKLLYETLVSDMQWKVRRTLAFSIHEMAVILGPELTHTDLVPIFNGFIKDLDEVRIGVLTHLYDFIQLLNQKERKAFLPKLVEFVNTDNNRVWRTRLDLAHQLAKLTELYSVDDVMEFIVPLAIQLLTDRVAEVRTASLHLISKILLTLKRPEHNQPRLILINDLIQQLALSKKWTGRQTYVQACHRVLVDDSLEPEQFAKELLPSIINLNDDKTPNVRIAVAMFFSQCLLPIEYFTSSKNPHHDRLIEVEARLKTDTDRDVRYFAALAPQTEITHKDTDFLLLAPASAGYKAVELIVETEITGMRFTKALQKSTITSL